jgi:hypothetical protein
MKASDLIKYINNPALLGKENIPELQKLVKDFPYFQSGHILLSLAAKKWDASVYQQSIKKTAIVVSNRAHLYELIHQRVEPENQIEVKLEEKLIEKQADKEEIKAAIKEETEEAKEKILSEKKQAQAVSEEQVEEEVQKAIVTAFVEKEILKTNQIHSAKDEPASFGDWLQMLKKNNGQSYSEIEEKVRRDKEEKAKSFEQKQEEQITKTKEKQKALIDKIIENNPGPIRPKEEQKFFKSDLKARESLLENEHLITETLAQIYALQGNINKAIRAYEILSLKYPQKSVYFASLIQKLKNNQ